MSKNKKTLFILTIIILGVFSFSCSNKDQKIETNTINGLMINM